MYIVKYNKFTKRWLVIDTNTGLAHSFWKLVVEANRAARDLNRSRRLPHIGG